MITKFNSKLCSFAVLATSIVFTVPAAAYTLQDDPSSEWGGDPTLTPTISGNVITYHDLFARNITDNSLPELNFAISFIWPRLEGIQTTFVPLEWRNDLNGWYTSNFNNTGTSLTVSLTNPGVSSVLMGNIADLTGSQQLPLTEPCVGSSPSCQDIDRPLETRNTTDLVPLFSLGAFQPHEAKNFDVSFTYTYGDQRVGAELTSFVANTLVPIPEPETYAMLLAGLGLIGFITPRSRKQVR